MNHKLFIIFLSVAVLFYSCETRTSKQEQQESKPKLSEITIQPLTNPEYPDAILEMVEPTEYDDYNAGKIRFLFDIRNFNLNSGNFISINLNNSNIYQTTNPETKLSIDEGNYFLVSFLCLPNRVSLKNYGNYVVRELTVGDPQKKSFESSDPMIFQNYPNGKVKSSENDQVLLDFYLINTSLSENGNQVKLEVDGQEFILTEWIPYYINGLKIGEHSIKLTLLNKSGNPVNSIFNSISTNFTLE